MRRPREKNRTEETLKESCRGFNVWLGPFYWVMGQRERGLGWSCCGVSDLFFSSLLLFLCHVVNESMGRGRETKNQTKNPRGYYGNFLFFFEGYSGAAHAFYSLTRGASLGAVCDTI